MTFSKTKVKELTSFRDPVCVTPKIQTKKAHRHECEPASSFSRFPGFCPHGVCRAVSPAPPLAYMETCLTPPCS